MVNNCIKLVVNNLLAKQRLDVFLCNNISNITRSIIINIIKQQGVLVNNKLVKKPSALLNNLDEIIFTNSYVPADLNLQPTNLNLQVLYQDKDFVVVYKPKGLTVHPGAGNYTNTLVNGLLFMYNNNLSNINGDFRPGIVHRLDKDTSGVLLVAKNNVAHGLVASQFQDHSIIRHYRALVWGKPNLSVGKIITNIARDSKNRTKMAVSNKAKDKQAITNYKVLHSNGIVSLLDLQLETGRTHQIRVHLQHLGNSIVADNTYNHGYNKYYNKLTAQDKLVIDTLQSQCLHAYRLQFYHPILHKDINITAPEPKELLNVYNNFNFTVT